MRIIVINADENFSVKNKAIDEFTSKLNYSDISCIESSKLVEFLEMIKSSEPIIIVDYHKFPLVLSRSTFDLLNKNSFYSSVKVLTSDNYDGNILVGKVYDILNDYQQLIHVKDKDIYFKQPIISLDLRTDNSDILNLYDIMSSRKPDVKKLNIMNYYNKKSVVLDDGKDIIHYVSLLSGVDKDTAELVIDRLGTLAGLFLRLESIETEDECPIIRITDNLNATIENGKVIYFSLDNSKTLKDISSESIESVVDFMMMTDRSRLQKRLIQEGDNR